MRTFKTVKKEEKVRDRVFCNRCGREVEPVCEGHDGNYLSVDKRWGYGSGYDGEYHSFDLCEKCYGEIIADFKISPLGEE